MSRFSSDYDEYDPLAQGRWEANTRRAIQGKRGQVALRELREALLALPEKRLVAGELATPRGDVCTVGCLVAYKRAKAKNTTITEAAKELATEDPDSWDGYVLNPDTGKYERQVERMRYDADARAMVGTGVFFTEARYHDDDAADYTAGKGVKEAGLVYSLAWELGWLNDEQWGRLTPEKRWEKCLAWVESHIGAEAPA